MVCGVGGPHGYFIPNRKGSALSLGSLSIIYLWCNQASKLYSCSLTLCRVSCTSEATDSTSSPSEWNPGLPVGLSHMFSWCWWSLYWFIANSFWNLLTMSGIGNREVAVLSLYAEFSVSNCLLLYQRVYI